MRTILLIDEAQEDLEQATRQYSKRNVQMASDFLVEYEAALARIRANPLLYAQDEDGTGARLCPVQRFEGKEVNDPVSRIRLQ